MKGRGRERREDIVGERRNGKGDYGRKGERNRKLEERGRGVGDEGKRKEEERGKKVGD